MTARADERMPPGSSGQGGRLKVLHILWSSHFGGVGRLILDLATQQKQDPGLEVALLLLHQIDGAFRAAFETTGLKLWTAAMRHGSHVSPSRFRAIAAILRQHDVLHVHHFHPLVALSTAWARKPVVFTMHSPIGHGRVLTLSDRINAALMGIYLNHFVQFVTFNSRFTERITRDLYGLERVASAVVYNGAPAPQSEAAEPALDAETAGRIGGRFVVGTAARFAVVKRLERLVEGFACFAQGKDNVLLMLVGDGPLRPQLEDLVRRHGVAEKVLFTGFRPNVAAYLRAMSVCVLPSAGETFGLAALEALGLGKPAVVFSDGGGVVEVVAGHSRADIVDDPESLAGRLNYYYRHPEQPCDAVRARQRYAMRFDVAVTAEQFRKIYCNLTSCAG